MPRSQLGCARISATVAVIYVSTATFTRYGPSTSLPALSMIANRRQRRLQLIRPQIRQQPPHQPAVIGLPDDVVIVRRLLGSVFLWIFRFFLVSHAGVFILDVSGPPGIRFLLHSAHDAC